MLKPEIILRLKVAIPLLLVLSVTLKGSNSTLELLFSKFCKSF